jgi:hypothetical protein
MLDLIACFVGHMVEGANPLPMRRDMGASPAQSTGQPSSFSWLPC